MNEPDKNAEHWSVWRQDENGNRVIVRAGMTEWNARAYALELEAKGHKQIYWVVRGPVRQIAEAARRFEVPTSGRWPSGKEVALAVIRETVQSLEERLSVGFLQNRDDLDSFLELPMKLRSGRLALLIRYEGEPFSTGPTIWVDSGDRLRDALDEVSEALDLGTDAFDWITPLLDQGTEPAANSQ